MKTLKSNDMRQAFATLDKHLNTPTQILIGGGAAMALAYNLPLSTADVVGLVFKSAITQDEIAPLVHHVARELNLPKDWLNSHFNTFLFALPADYVTRLKIVFTGKHLTVHALGREDMVILKCCAGRDKDLPHARAIMKQGINRELVSNHLQSLMERGIANASAAADFFDELCDQVP